MSFLSHKHKIVLLGSKVLLSEASPIPVEEILSPEIQGLIEGMTKAMKDGRGVGLAGPQVGELKRIFIVSPAVKREQDAIIEDFHDVFINPEILEKSAESVIGLEGCLSIPDLYGDVPRAKTVKVRAYGKDGKKFEINASDFYARVIQHENDHLDGILFLFRMRDLKTLRIEY